MNSDCRQNTTVFCWIGHFIVWDINFWFRCQSERLNWVSSELLRCGSGLCLCHWHQHQRTAYTPHVHANRHTHTIPANDENNIAIASTVRQLRSKHTFDLSSTLRYIQLLFIRYPNTQCRRTFLLCDCGGVQHNRPAHFAAFNLIAFVSFYRNTKCERACASHSTQHIAKYKRCRHFHHHSVPLSLSHRHPLLLEKSALYKNVCNNSIERLCRHRNGKWLWLPSDRQKPILMMSNLGTQFSARTLMFALNPFQSAKWKWFESMAWGCSWNANPKGIAAHTPYWFLSFVSFVFADWRRLIFGMSAEHFARRKKQRNEILSEGFNRRKKIEEAARVIRIALGDSPIPFAYGMRPKQSFLSYLWNFQADSIHPFWRDWKEIVRVKPKAIYQTQNTNNYNLYRSMQS